MFEKRDYIYNETLGVCKVVDIVKLAAKNSSQAPIDYYHLKSVADKNKDAYIPVDNHQVVMRKLKTLEEAKAVSEEELEKMPQLLQEEIAFILKQEEKRLQRLQLEREKRAERERLSRETQKLDEVSEEA